MTQYPVIHLNGSGHERLADQYGDVLHAVRNLKERLRVNYPHSRDYYPEEGAFERAQAQHVERLRAVDKMEADIKALVVFCRSRGTVREL